MHDLIREKLKLGNQYIISFAGLKEGEHRFRFGFKQEFFDAHKVLEARTGMLEAIVILDRKKNLLDLEVSVRGSLEIQCDRCLDFFDFPIVYRGNLIVKFGDDLNAGTDEIWILPPGEHKLDLEQYFFECIGLCLPIRRIHPDDRDGKTGCNTDMLQRLDHHSTKPERKEDDPRWDKLKNILNNTNNN